MLSTAGQWAAGNATRIIAVNAESMDQLQGLRGGEVTVTANEEVLLRAFGWGLHRLKEVRYLLIDVLVRDLRVEIACHYYCSVFEHRLPSPRSLRMFCLGQCVALLPVHLHHFHGAGKTC